MLKLVSFVVLMSTTKHPNNSLSTQSNLNEQHFNIFGVLAFFMIFRKMSVSGGMGGSEINLFCMRHAVRRLLLDIGNAVTEL